MEKSAKRLSSIFSHGSTSSEKGNADNRASSLHTPRDPRTLSPSRSPQPSTSTLQPSASSPNLRTSSIRQSLQSGPAFDHTRLTATVGKNILPPGIFKPAPLPPGSLSTIRPGGTNDSRPGSPPKNFSRPSSSDGIRAASPSREIRRPMTPTFEYKESSRPTSRGGLIPASRPTSRAGLDPTSRPSSPVKHLSRPATPTTEKRVSKRRSWLPGRSKHDSADEAEGAHVPQRAWVLGPEQQRPYDVTPLLGFQKVPELWNERGNTFVYLHSHAHSRGPSFRLDSSFYASSRKLSSLAHGGTQNELDSPSLEGKTCKLSLNSPISPPRSPRQGTTANSSLNGSRTFSDSFDDSLEDIHLYLPQPLRADLANTHCSLDQDDVDILMTIRNLFAFLTGQPLVATLSTPTVFPTLLKLANVLQRYDFTNIDGSTLGEEAAGNFARFVQDFKVGDIRASREKTIQAIILGERMRFWDLYNEGFVHAVGKYEDITSLRSPKFALISSTTRQRMERATLDLNARLKNVRSRLETFDFPSLFAGIANSTTSSESKVIRFKDWKMSFVSMRKHILTFYREKYGAWPPKAKSKKNDFEESGLNRLLLQELYQDFSDLYDILVDRASLTTRSIDVPSLGHSEPDDGQEPAPRALRRVMSEYDRSTPPVQPPIPFDTPLLPSLSSTRRDFTSLDEKRQRKERAKKLNDNEINQALMQSYNRDGVKSTPFLEAFMSFERRSAHGCSIEEIRDLRHGQWIFLYAVLQALPLVVVDAPGLKWTKGVEYFLCEVPKGNAPWIHEKSSIKQNWYGIAGGAGVVSLPADIVDHGVDGIYHRSHAWQAAEKWATYHANASAPVSHADLYDDLAPPQLPVVHDAPNSRTSSPSRRSQRDSTNLGLEALPLPANVTPSGARPTSMYDPGKSFDDILGTMNPPGGKKKK